MTIGDLIKNDKLQYDINKEAANISALSSGKIDKYEYPTSEEIIPPDQGTKVEQAKFIYSPLSKEFEKTNKNNWITRKKTSPSFGSEKSKTKTSWRSFSKINNKW